MDPTEVLASLEQAGEGQTPHAVALRQKIKQRDDDRAAGLRLPDIDGAQNVLRAMEGYGEGDSEQAKALRDKIEPWRRKRAYVRARQDADPSVTERQALGEYDDGIDTIIQQSGAGRAFTFGGVPGSQQFEAGAAAGLSALSRTVRGAFGADVKDTTMREDYDRLLAAQRAGTDKFMADSPVLGTVAQAAGAVQAAGATAGTVMASRAGAYVPQMATRFLPSVGQRTVGRLGQMAAAGAAGGASYGFQAGRGGFENRASDAAEFAAYGALGGVIGYEALRALSPAVRDGASREVRVLRMIGEELDAAGVPLGDGASPIGRRFSADGAPGGGGDEAADIANTVARVSPEDTASGMIDPDSFAGAAGRDNPDLMAADFVADLAGSAYRLGSDAARKAFRDALTGRSTLKARTDRLMRAFTRALDIGDPPASVIKEGRSKLKTLYETLKKRGDRGWSRTDGLRIPDKQIPIKELDPLDPLVPPNGKITYREYFDRLIDSLPSKITKAGEDILAMRGDPDAFDTATPVPTGENFDRLKPKQVVQLLKERGYHTSRRYDGPDGPMTRLEVEQARARGDLPKPVVMKPADKIALLRQVADAPGGEGAGVGKLQAMKMAANDVQQSAAQSGDKNLASAAKTAADRLRVVRDGIRDGSQQRAFKVGDAYHRVLSQAIEAFETASGVGLKGKVGPGFFRMAPEDLIAFRERLDATRADIAGFKSKTRDKILVEFDKAYDAFRQGAVRSYLDFLQGSSVAKNARVFDDDHQAMAARLRTLWPDGEAGDKALADYLRTVDTEGIMQAAEGRILYGSQTAERLAQDAKFAGNVEFSVMDVLRMADLQSAVRFAMERGGLYLSDRFVRGMTERTANALMKQLARKDFAALAAEIRAARAAGRAPELSRLPEATRRAIDETIDQTTRAAARPNAKSLGPVDYADGWDRARVKGLPADPERSISDRGVNHAMRKHSLDADPLSREHVPLIEETLKTGETVTVGYSDRGHLGRVVRKQFGDRWLYAVENFRPNKNGNPSKSLDFSTAWWRTVDDVAQTGHRVRRRSPEPLKVRGRAAVWLDENGNLRSRRENESGLENPYYLDDPAAPDPIGPVYDPRALDQQTLFGDLPPGGEMARERAGSSLRPTPIPGASQAPPTPARSPMSFEGNGASRANARRRAMLARDQADQQAVFNRAQTAEREVVEAQIRIAELEAELAQLKGQQPDPASLARLRALRQRLREMPEPTPRPEPEPNPRPEYEPVEPDFDPWADGPPIPTAPPRPQSAPVEPEPGQTVRYDNDPRLRDPQDLATEDSARGIAERVAGDRAVDVMFSTVEEFDAIAREMVRQGLLKPGSKISAFFDNIISSSDARGRIRALIGRATDQDIYEELAHLANALNLWSRAEFKALSAAALKDTDIVEGVRRSYGPLVTETRDAFVDEVVAKYVAKKAAQSKGIGGRKVGWLRNFLGALDAADAPEIAARFSAGDYKKKLIDRVEMDMQRLSQGKATELSLSAKRHNMLPVYLDAFFKRYNADAKFKAPIERALRKGNVKEAMRLWEKAGGGATLGTIGGLILLLNADPAGSGEEAARATTADRPASPTAAPDQRRPASLETPVSSGLAFPGVAF